MAKAKRRSLSVTMVKGFDLGGSLADLPRAGKLGLAGMEERVRLLNGSMNIESELGKGTRVTIQVPI